MYKIVNHAVDKAHEEKYGRFNDFPPNWREISLGDFAKSKFFSYQADLIEYRQMYEPAPPGENRFQHKYLSAKLFFFFDGTGLAMSSDYWKGSITYYAFGCEHKYKELSKAECAKRGITHHGHCWHVDECQSCKYIFSYDSSG